MGSFRGDYTCMLCDDNTNNFIIYKMNSNKNQEGEEEKE